MYEWTRIHAGYYTRDDGCEITKIRSRWVLSHPYRDETRFRSLRAAKYAADR